MPLCDDRLLDIDFWSVASGVDARRHKTERTNIRVSTQRSGMWPRQLSWTPVFRAEKEHTMTTRSSRLHYDNEHGYSAIVDN